MALSHHRWCLLPLRVIGFITLLLISHGVRADDCAAWGASPQPYTVPQFTSVTLKDCYFAGTDITFILSSTSTLRLLNWRVVGGSVSMQPDTSGFNHLLLEFVNCTVSATTGPALGWFPTAGAMNNVTVNVTGSRLNSTNGVVVGVCLSSSITVAAVRMYVSQSSLFATAAELSSMNNATVAVAAGFVVTAGSNIGLTGVSINITDGSVASATANPGGGGASPVLLCLCAGGIVTVGGLVSTLSASWLIVSSTLSATALGLSSGGIVGAASGGLVMTGGLSSASSFTFSTSASQLSTRVSSSASTTIFATAGGATINASLTSSGLSSSQWRSYASRVTAIGTTAAAGASSYCSALAYAFAGSSLQQGTLSVNTVTFSATAGSVVQAVASVSSQGGDDAVAVALGVATAAGPANPSTSSVQVSHITATAASSSFVSAEASAARWAVAVALGVAAPYGADITSQSSIAASDSIVTSNATLGPYATTSRGAVSAALGVATCQAQHTASDWTSVALRSTVSSTGTTTVAASVAVAAVGIAVAAASDASAGTMSLRTLCFAATQSNLTAATSCSITSGQCVTATSVAGVSIATGSVTVSTQPTATDVAFAVTQSLVACKSRSSTVMSTSSEAIAALGIAFGFTANPSVTTAVVLLKASTVTLTSTTTVGLSTSNFMKSCLVAAVSSYQTLAVTGFITSIDGSRVDVTCTVLGSPGVSLLGASGSIAGVNALSNAATLAVRDSVFQAVNSTLTLAVNATQATTSVLTMTSLVGFATGASTPFSSLTLGNISTALSACRVSVNSTALGGSSSTSNRLALTGWTPHAGGNTQSYVALLDGTLMDACAITSSTAATSNFTVAQSEFDGLPSICNSTAVAVTTAATALPLAGWAYSGCLPSSGAVPTTTTLAPSKKRSKTRTASKTSSDTRTYNNSQNTPPNSTTNPPTNMPTNVTTATPSPTGPNNSTASPTTAASSTMPPNAATTTLSAGTTTKAPPHRRSHTVTVMRPIPTVNSSNSSTSTHVPPQTTSITTAAATPSPNVTTDAPTQAPVLSPAAATTQQSVTVVASSASLVAPAAAEFATGVQTLALMDSLQCGVTYTGATTPSPAVVPFTLIFSGALGGVVALLALNAASLVAGLIAIVVLSATERAKTHCRIHQLTPLRWAAAKVGFPGIVMTLGQLTVQGFAFVAAQQLGSSLGDTQAGALAAAAAVVVLASYVGVHVFVCQGKHFDPSPYPPTELVPSHLRWARACGRWGPWGLVGQYSVAFAGYREGRVAVGAFLTMCRPALLGLVAGMPAASSGACSARQYGLAVICFAHGVAVLCLRPARVIALSFPSGLSSLLTGLAFVTRELNLLNASQGCALAVVACSVVGVGVSVVTFAVKKRYQDPEESAAKAEALHAALTTPMLVIPKSSTALNSNALSANNAPPQGQQPLQPDASLVLSNSSIMVNPLLVSPVSPPAAAANGPTTPLHKAQGSHRELR